MLEGQESGLPFCIWKLISMSFLATSLSAAHGEHIFRHRRKIQKRDFGEGRLGCRRSLGSDLETKCIFECIPSVVATLSGSRLIFLGFVRVLCCRMLSRKMYTCLLFSFHFCATPKIYDFRFFGNSPASKTAAQTCRIG